MTTKKDDPAIDDDSRRVELKEVELAGEPGSSHEQREAETVMVRLLSDRVGADLRPTRLDLPGGGWVVVDAYNPTARGVDGYYIGIACEAWAHVGDAKPAQRNKVAADILKLMLVRSLVGERLRLILLFGDEAAAKFLRGNSWRAAAVHSLDIEIEVVTLPPDIRNKVINAQRRQYR